MMNAMVCHIAEGELRIEQDGKTFTAKKNFAWTCNKDIHFEPQLAASGNATADRECTRCERETAVASAAEECTAQVQAHRITGIRWERCY